MEWISNEVYRREKLKKRKKHRTSILSQDSCLSITTIDKLNTLLLDINNINSNRPNHLIKKKWI